MSATVHQAFRDSAARHGAQPFLCILPETVEAYGIAAGELAYGAARRGHRDAARRLCARRLWPRPPRRPAA
ncbi:hypothetical protein WJ970_35880 [Achromobacter xylosoxidans]